MKNFTRITIFHIVLILGIFTANAQNNTDDYYPLVEEGKVWSELVFTSDPSGLPNYDYYTVYYKIYGDTIANDIYYKKIYRTARENAIFPDDWVIDFYIRENDNKQILYKRSLSGWERMLYDFSLEVGDILPEEIYEGGDIIIESITYELMENGEERKVFWLSDYCHVPEFWIEGVGSSFGLEKTLGGFITGGSYKLLCHWQNETLLYHNSSYETCFESSLLIENYSKFNIYPNPVKDILHIQNTDNSDINCISLININGQVIEQYQPKTTQINISNIKEGIYFIRFSTKERDIIQKIVIEK
ncbi:MAG: T9SS type A sorting domain-containing protein [Bacteroidales bacterium]|jgi:hypothetical protein|nr:T9SS type A sorting domain-containing protein [Bacteroidales bacterium]